MRLPRPLGDIGIVCPSIMLLPMPLTFQVSVLLAPAGITVGSALKDSNCGGRTNRILRVLVATRSVPVATRV